MEVLSIIPVRGGSKGIPGKNIKLLAGKPLVSYTIEASQKSKYITRTIVSTEDKKIKHVCETYGAEVIDRPPELAQDETKTAPVMPLEEGKVISACLVVPLENDVWEICKFATDEAFELYLKSDCDSVFAAFSAGTTHARWRKSPFTGEYECLYDYRNRPRRQDTDLHYPLFIESGAIYIVKTEVMKEVKDFIGYKPEIYLQKNPVDIDTIADFEKAEKLILERRLNSK